MQHSEINDGMANSAFKYVMRLSDNIFSKKK
jgi:hypothetical protein